MNNVTIEKREQVAVLRLTNGVTNAISPQFVEDFSDALKHIREEFNGLVLAGGSKFFSIGLDLPGLLKLDRTEMAGFWEKFNDITFDLFTVPFPTICTLEGHAIAGGTILALCCDYRFGAANEKKLGLNEIKLGVPVPYLPDLLLRQLVGDRAATRMLYYGNFVSMSEAKQIQLVDKLFPTKDLEDESVKEAVLLAAMPGPALAIMKRNRIEAIRIRYEENIEQKSQEFLDCWFSAPVQELLKKASEAF